jgi:glyoxylase-like metal-dependent hydrolase (beta-lactamase superfamily II)
VSGETTPLPVTCYVIEHPTLGRLLWDTGMNPVVQTDPLGHWGGIAKRMTIPVQLKGEDVVSTLETGGIRADDIDLIMNSHLHNDHCGMNKHFDNATVLTRRREFDHAVSLMDTRSSGFVRGDFFGEHKQELFDYEDEYNLTEDGAITLISTPGHTPGHQCLRIRAESGQHYLLTGDAVYSVQDLEMGEGPGIAWDVEQAARSVQRIKSYLTSGDRVLVCHDAHTWADAAPLTLVHDDSAEGSAHVEG